MVYAIASLAALYMVIRILSKRGQRRRQLKRKRSMFDKGGFRR